MVISSPNYTSPSSIVAIFLTTYLTAVIQPSGYSIFHGGVTSISISILKSLLGIIGVIPLKSLLRVIEVILLNPKHLL